jgi:ABC-type nitrate/sulfonate/bicarbonate transport system substrate-binding protein
MTARAWGYTDSKTHRHGLCVAAISILILIHTIPALCAQVELEPVAIQLRWFNQFQFAVYYAAVEKGLYADEGLQGLHAKFNTWE